MKKAMQIVLLGTSHTLQRGDQTAWSAVQISDFEEFVSKLCREHKVKLIAEEMSLDVLIRIGKITTVADAVAKEQKISHRHVDMERQEREALKIDDSSLAKAASDLYKNTESQGMREVLNQVISSHVRERDWLARIIFEGVSPTLFICGAEHVESMHNLIKSINLEVVVAAIDYPNLLD